MLQENLTDKLVQLGCREVSVEIRDWKCREWWHLEDAWEVSVEGRGGEIALWVERLRPLLSKLHSYPLQDVFLRYCHLYFSNSVKPHFPVFLWEWNRPRPLLPKLHSFSRYISQTLSCVFIWFCKTIFPCFPLRLYLERPQPLQCFTLHCFTDFVPFRFSKYEMNGEDGLRYCSQMRVWLRERVKPPELWCVNQIGDLDVLLDWWMFFDDHMHSNYASFMPNFSWWCI